ncbi:uracil-DNA glycosylase-like protein [Vararia minispora EC-137]|uniref:Uracil-DNA glycosylase-like protein n=1 Tax=Vararia minispora EC-137 TaxID=1314806 RepID=A0ACB8QLD6_9AGAM|nr:uracil-DNA glycosylase-like protein [Vararia minispora EC-137]
MDKGRRVVYYEDLTAVKTSDKKDENASIAMPDASGTATSVTVQTKGTAVAGPSATGIKRQRTLMDMFTAPALARPEEPEAKKLRVNGSTDSLSNSSSSSPATNLKPAAAGFGLQPLNSIPYSPSAFTASLTDDQKRLLRLEIETMGKSWLKLLKDEIKKPYFIALKEFLWKEGVRGPDDSDKALKVYPAPKNIYAWSNFTPLGKVKVVIIGQDPYHGPGQAHGLCFSVPQGVAVPPSLRNIYAEIKSEYPGFEPPKSGSLAAWAADGVLLLNTALTVRTGAAGSHQGKGWETFTDKVVNVVDRYGGANLGDRVGYGRGVVFMAWGSWAQKRVVKLDKKKHLVLQSAHPSPLSASKGFFGNGHFKAANDWLAQHYGDSAKVDWCNLTVRPPADV